MIFDFKPCTLAGLALVGQWTRRQCEQQVAEGHVRALHVYTDGSHDELKKLTGWGYVVLAEHLDGKLLLGSGRGGQCRD